MEKYTINDTTLVAIADAIRAKSGTTSGIDPANMAALIAAIEAGGGGSKVETFTYTPASDMDAYNSEIELASTSIVDPQLMAGFDVTPNTGDQNYSFGAMICTKDGVDGAGRNQIITKASYGNNYKIVYREKFNDKWEDALYIENGILKVKSYHFTHKVILLSGRKYCFLVVGT